MFELEEIEIAPKATTKGWLADDPEMKAIYPITPEIARHSVPIGAIGTDGKLRYGEENTYQSSGYVVMEHRRARLRWINQIY